MLEAQTGNGEGGPSVAVVGLLIGFLGLVFNKAFDSWAARKAKSEEWHRARTDAAEQWAREQQERTEVAMLLAKNTEAIKTHAALMANNIRENTELTKQAISNATDAYREANTVNLKIEKLGVALNLNNEPVDTRRETGPTTKIKLEEKEL